MAPRAKKGGTKSTMLSKTNATKKRALPQEDKNVTANAAIGEKPSKRLRSSTTVGADVEAKISTAPHTTKPGVEVAQPRTTNATPSTADAPTAVLLEAPTGIPSTSATATATVANQTQVFTGSFDLYSMDIEALNIAYAPPYDTNGSFDDAFYPKALYEAIIASKPETKVDEDGEEVVVGGPTAKLNIPIPGTNTNTSDLGLNDEYDDEENDSYGTLTLSTFFHPYCGGPIEIAVTEIKEQSQEALNSEIETPDLGRPTEAAWDAPGISATLEIQDYHLMTMIPEASGKLCMRPLWKGVGEDGKEAELFEGRVTFRCYFARVWWKRGGKGRNEDVVFWAVRGRA